MNNLNGFFNDFSSGCVRFSNNASCELNQFANQVENEWEQLTSSLLVPKEQANQEGALIAQEEINNQQDSSSEQNLSSLDEGLYSGIFAKSILPFFAFKEHLSCLSVSKSWNAFIIKNTRFNPLHILPQELFSSIISLLNFKDVCSSLTVGKNWNESIVKYRIDKQSTFKDLVELQSECNDQLEYYQKSDCIEVRDGVFRFKEFINQRIDRHHSVKLNIELLRNKMEYLIKQGHFQELKNVLCERMCLIPSSPLYNFNENKSFITVLDIGDKNINNAETICFDFLIAQSLEKHLFEDALDLIFKRAENSLLFSLMDNLKEFMKKVGFYFSERDLTNDELGKRLISLIESIEKRSLGWVNNEQQINVLECSHLKIEYYKKIFCNGMDDEREIIPFLSHLLKIGHFSDGVNQVILPFLSSLLNQAPEKDYFLSLGTDVTKHSEIKLVLREKKKIFIQLFKEGVEKGVNFLKEWEQKHPGAIPDLRQMLFDMKTAVHDTLREFFEEGEEQARYFGDSSS